jgi:hypothetical protein
VTLKVDPKAACDPEKCSESRPITLEKINQWVQRKAKTKIDAAFGTIFEINQCCQRSKQKNFIYFPLENGRLKFKNPSCMCGK